MKSKLTSLLSWLKEAFQNIAGLIGSLFLNLLAIILFIICFFPAIIWKVIASIGQKKRKIRDILTGTTKFFVGIAIALDQVGNVAFGGFFNWLFLKDPVTFAFGNTHETVSEVLGWNQTVENLNRKGKLMVSILNVIEKDHCLKAMTSGLFDAKYKVSAFSEIETINDRKAFIEKYS